MILGYDETSFDYNIDYICNSTIEDTINLIKLQGKTMDSFIQNFNLYAFEYTLNKLYENMRIMQDLTSYTKAFIEQSLDYALDECKQLIADIDKDIDSTKTKSYKTTNIPLTVSLDIPTDRNGIVMSKCDLYNGSLIMSGDSKKEVKISSINKDKGYMAYRSNLDEVLSGKAYRTFYILDGPVSGGLKEEINFTLDSPTDIDYIDITLSNCNVDSIALTDVNNNIIPIDNSGNVSCKNQIKSILFNLDCNNYTKKTYFADTVNMDKDFWSEVAEYEYDSAAGITPSTMFDIDTASGLNANRSQSSTFVSSVANYYKDAADNQVLQTNYQVLNSKINSYNANPDIVMGGDSTTSHIVVSSTIQVPVTTVIIANDTDYDNYYKSFSGITNVIVRKASEITTSDLTTYNNLGYNIMTVGAANNDGSLNTWINAGIIKGETRLQTAAQAQAFARLTASKNGEAYSGDPFYIVCNDSTLKTQIQNNINTKNCASYVTIVSSSALIADKSNVIYIDQTVQATDQTGGYHLTYDTAVDEINKVLDTFVEINSFAERKI